MQSSKVYEMRIFANNIPVYGKLIIQKQWFPMKIYLWKLEWMTEPDTDSEKPRKIKGDLVIYMSLYNWKPSYEDHDYFMKGNYLQLNLTKVQKTDYLFLAF